MQKSVIEENNYKPIEPGSPGMPFVTVVFIIMPVLLLVAILAGARYLLEC